MKRRIIKQKDSYTITLPIDWIREFKLNEKQEVDVNIEHNKVIISALPSSVSSTKVRITTTIESAIRTILTNAYRLGYDRVEVECDPEIKNKIKEICNKDIKEQLPGFEITQESSNGFIIELLTEIQSTKYEVFILKLFYAINELLNLCETKLKNKRPDIELNDIENKIKMYDNMCRRLFIKLGPITKRTYLFWTFLTLLIHAQRELYFFAEKLEKLNKKEYSNKLNSIFMLTKQAFIGLINAYKNKDSTLIEKLHEQEKNFDINENIKELPNDEFVLAFHLISSKRKVYLASSPLIGLII